MFPTFSGASRRPRQVNLSGRNNANPFAAAGTGGSQAALASAQKEREHRQRERDRLNSARLIQRSWRGTRCRRKIKQELREEWDNEQSGPSTSEAPYSSEEQSLSQLRRLVMFIDTRQEQDIARLLSYYWRQRASKATDSSFGSEGPWVVGYLRIQDIILSGIDYWCPKVVSPMDNLLEMLNFFGSQTPIETARNAARFYRSMAPVTTTISDPVGLAAHSIELIVRTLGCPIRSMTPHVLTAYDAFACHYLAAQNLEKVSVQHWIRFIADEINYMLLANALAGVVKDPARMATDLPTANARLHLLAAVIYLHRHAHNFRNPQAYSSHPDFVAIVSNLLASIADDVSLDAPTDDEEETTGKRVTNEFLREQIMSLVNQESVSSLLSNTSSTANRDDTRDSKDHIAQDARNLATYALSLLRFFPRKGDEIRMWLYLGSTQVASGQSKRKVPAIKYFWRAARSTSVFQTVMGDSRAAIKLLKSRVTDGWRSPHSAMRQEEVTNDEWRIILIFLELYTFVLKVMDDEEFFSGADTTTPSISSATWVRDNALPLSEVKDLTVFLKNLGFTMYFNAAEISDLGEQERYQGKLSNYFNITSHTNGPAEVHIKQRSNSVAGLSGISIDYVKGLVTGLLRMVYERDSRRTFLPKAHWLMTDRFDMEGFIEAVVKEEEKRHQVQEEEDGEEDQNDLDQDSLEPGYNLVGTRRVQQTRFQDRLSRQQRKASRKRFLQTVAPRLEILQNMPFFIPFATRVQIFRTFVSLDQEKRRGTVDPENWRLNRSQVGGHHDSLERHHAKIRRQHEFDDAYNSFYQLKEGLKEPIQITFVDQFDTVEAGIDGGGVTKEFLTSVTSQAFSQGNGHELFVENDQHLLYPNPIALDETREMLREAIIREGSSEYRGHITDLMQRYEFLGRIIGKCLYEGILVDINFAGFFLLKWALTGGAGSAPKESGYRANLNDLRDLDEALYQGLLQLKNYAGDVEDFSLNFTITDTIARNGKTVTRDLKPDGASLPVTNENRLVYISYVARHRLQIQPGPQTNAFLRGLGSMIQPSWLSMFNQTELQTLIGGTSSSISVPDLRANTAYGGVYVIGDDGLEHPTVQMFWSVMESLSDEERRKVLKFVTSTPRAPLLGFGSLNPRFSIRDSGADESRLPSTSTCVNLLKLPRYTSESVLKEKLLYAVNSGAGFDLS